MYNYEEEKPKLFNAEGIKAIDNVRKQATQHFEKSGCFVQEKVNTGIADGWLSIAVFDFLVELQEFKSIRELHSPTQHTIYRPGVAFTPLY